MTQVRRLGSAAGAVAMITATVATTVMLLAVPAHAQLDTINVPVPDTGTVEDTVGEVGGTVGDTTSGATEPVGDVADSVGGTVKDTGASAGDTVKDTGGSVGGTVGGPAGDAVKDTSGSVGGTIKDTTGNVADTIDDTATKTGGTVNDVVEGASSGGFIGSDPGAISIGDGILGPGDTDGVSSGDPSLGSINGNGAATGGIQVSDSFASAADVAMANSIQGLDLELLGQRVGEASDVRAPVELNGLAEEALEAAKRFAFPLALTLIVVGFMVIQGRLDRRDPKLTVASVDPDQDLLSFS